MSALFWCADKMSSGEFDLIGAIFLNTKGNQHFVDFSIGDDCAITHIPEDYQLAITTDTMVEGTHFYLLFPQDLAYPVIATNLSDLLLWARNHLDFSCMTLPKLMKTGLPI